MTSTHEPAAHTIPVIGLLGAPGSGKSAIARHFASLGCGVIDADRIAREALEQPGVRDQLVRWWGRNILDSSGRIQRGAVADRVFDDAPELARLEGVVHPIVHDRRHAMRDAFRADPATAAIVEDCPLLLEKGLDAGCDVLVYVDAAREVRLARLAEHRGWSEADLDRREKRQWPLDTKRRRADYVIDNGGDAASSLAQTRRVLSQITRSRV